MTPVLLESARRELSAIRHREYEADKDSYLAQRRAETWLCPHCESLNVHHSSYGDGIICNGCGFFACYPWDFGPGRSAPAIRRFT